MWRNYILTAFRNLKRQSGYTFINVLGLTVGLASALLIAIYVDHEWSYDRFHKDSERIYRISETVPNGDSERDIASTSYALAEAIKNDFSELEAVTHFSRPEDTDVIYGEKQFFEERIHVVDSAFFDVFGFEFLRGDETSVQRPNTVVITESMAEKYFGTDDPIGKDLRFVALFNGSNVTLTVAAILADMPENSHFHMDMLIGDVTTRKWYSNGMTTSWGWDSFYTYVKLPENYAIDQLAAGFPDLVKKHIGEDVDWLKYFPRALEDIHLQSNINSELEANGSEQNVYIFTIVGFVILLIASINYMNLATAIAARRGKEVGIRKTLGSLKGQLATQFITEAMVITMISALLGGFLAELITPYFNSISGKNLSIGFTEEPARLLIFLGLSLIIGLISGLYPAFYLASFKTIRALKGMSSSRKSNAIQLRKGLVIFQFATSTFLIIASLIVYDQWTFMQNKDYGVNTESMVVFSLQSGENSQRLETIKSKLRANPNVLEILNSSRRIGRDINRSAAIAIQETDTSYQQIAIANIEVDLEFLESIGTEMNTGRSFSPNIISDTAQSIIINETAANLLNDFDPTERNFIGIFNGERQTGRVLGVVKDFHFESLYRQIKPMVFIPTLLPQEYLTVRVNSSQLQETVDYIEEVWAVFDPSRTLQYDILSEDIRNLYVAENRFFKLFTLATGLAIFIACMGTLGLSAFATSQRIREIGIRKVLGASVGGIASLLTRQFLQLTLIANLIAVPFGLWFAKRWLDGFSYRIAPEWHYFALAILIAAGFASLTILTQTICAARGNPVDALRSE